MITYEDLPLWLREHYEKEWPECWVFYIKGGDFTEEQYQELRSLRFEYYRSPNCVNSEYIGVEIKLYKTKQDFENTSYQYPGIQSHIKLSKRR